MKMSDDYAKNPEAVKNQELLMDAIHNRTYLHPVVDIHSCNEKTGETFVWLKMVDKDQKHQFLLMNSEFIQALSKNIMIAKGKQEMIFGEKDSNETN